MYKNLEGLTRHIAAFCITLKLHEIELNRNLSGLHAEVVSQILARISVILGFHNMLFMTRCPPDMLRGELKQECMQENT